VSEPAAHTDDASHAGWSAAELAALLDAEMRGPAAGDGSAAGRFTTLVPLDDETSGSAALTFIRDAKHARRWPASRAGGVIVSRRAFDEAAANFPASDPRPVLVVPDADAAMIVLLGELCRAPARPEPGAHASAAIDPSAEVHPSVRIGPGVSVGPRSRVGEHAVLHAGVRLGGDVEIGAHSELMANVVVQDRCTIGAHCLLHPGVVIGADGFGFRPGAADGSGPPIVKIPHVGAVRISDHVEIGANSAIDRGKLGDTVVGSFTKIDNLVQIGHNVAIGRACVICGLVGIAGSVRIGDGVTIAGAVGIADNLEIGDGATIGGKSAVGGNIPAGETWIGVPAHPARQYMRIVSAMRQLPDALQRVKRLFPQQEDPA
jgi:UDP-3-O-[3-hydroxymyristoyl] glucosamine N-acyltransferase